MRIHILWIALLLVGFDHAAHQAKSPAECRSCHVKPTARLGHAACFGACHGPAPKVKAKTRPKKDAPVCAACHGGATTDVGVTMSHAGHAATDCESCHGKAKAHARCNGCHRSRAKPAIDDCTGCHAGAARPALAPGALPLTGFAHATHARKTKASCAACHGAIAGAAELALPAPTTGDCASCHDGKAAFSTTEKCTACHTGAPATPPALVRPTARFSHEQHRSKIAEECASCHGLDRRGEATAPAHGACAASGCHRDDFASAAPTICAACHAAIEPWRALVVDAPPPPRTEMGSTMPHRAHAKLGLPCAGCHAIADADRQLRPAHGHATCTGEACHRATGGAEPTLTTCDRCHRIGLVAARVQERLAAKWTVRARFDHDTHQTDCAGCHARVWEVDGAPPVPTASVCETCHDGKTAFKMTGHGCARCHGR